VTICAKDRECLFGEVVDGEMRLSDFGEIVKRHWLEIRNHFHHIIQDTFVVMPNHVHGVLVIFYDDDRLDVGARHAVPLRPYQTEQFRKPVPGSIPTIIRSFKSAVTKGINEMRNTPGAPVWQRNYYEHIIRDEKDLAQIREYIIQNPAKWEEDEYHPDKTGSLRARHASPLRSPAIKGTKTSSFGSPGRVNHDSSAFYASRLYESLPKEEKVKYTESQIAEENIDRIFCKSSVYMAELPDNSVHLMVTSPPYNVGKDYDEDLTLEEYRAFLKRVWAEVKRVLVPGGRACINIANLGRRPYIPLNAFIVQDMLELGFLHRGEIIWNKAAGGSPSTAWGSWKSAKNPILRDIHEYIMVFSKGSFSRENLGRKSSISKDQFLEYTKSVWTFGAESAKKVGHPAPFPVELPYRLIQLYTFEGEVVLDPFAGSGQAALAALKTNRHYVGYETDAGYVKLAEKRIQEYSANQFEIDYNVPS